MYSWVRGIKNDAQRRKHARVYEECIQQAKLSGKNENNLMKYCKQFSTKTIRFSFDFSFVSVSIVFFSPSFPFSRSTFFLQHWFNIHDISLYEKSELNLNPVRFELRESESTAILRTVFEKRIHPNESVRYSIFDKCGAYLFCAHIVSRKILLFLKMTD